jgi:hypothetical protein
MNCLRWRVVAPSLVLVMTLLRTAAGGTTTPPVFVRNYEPVGAFGDHGQEASPFFLNGQLYMMQSIMGRPANGSQGVHSLFCVYNATSGAQVVCPDSSSGFAFCSAVVDRTGPPERLWVFCSAWDRANHSYCPDPGSWGCGACADAQRGVGDGCYVGAWSTEDLESWSGPHRALTLPLNQTVPNVGVSMVTRVQEQHHSQQQERRMLERDAALSAPSAAAAAATAAERPLGSAAPPPAPPPAHQAFMAIENPHLPLAVNVGTDRNLTANWVRASLLSSTGSHSPEGRNS